MDHVDEISVEELQDALNNVEGNKPTQRLLAAIVYKNGVTQTELAELNPVEECWRQLQDALSNRFFDSLDELTTAIDTALDQLSLPKASNYF